MGMGSFGRALFLLGMEEEAMEGPGIFPCWQQEVSRWSRDVASAAVEIAMLHDKIRGDSVTEKIPGASRMINSDCEILVHLEVKVRRVHSVIITDGADLLTPFDLLSLLHHDPIEMTIERVGKMQPPVLDPGMSYHHNIPPVGPDIAG